MDDDDTVGPPNPDYAISADYII